MATYPDRIDFDIEEQRVRILRATDEVEKFSAETRKIVAETNAMPKVVGFQAMLATAVLLGAGAAIAKLFFP